MTLHHLSAKWGAQYKRNCLNFWLDKECCIGWNKYKGIRFWKYAIFERTFIYISMTICCIIFATRTTKSWMKFLALVFFSFPMSHSNKLSVHLLTFFKFSCCAIFSFKSTSNSSLFKFWHISVYFFIVKRKISFLQSILKTCLHPLLHWFTSASPFPILNKWNKQG